MHVLMTCSWQHPANVGVTKPRQQFLVPCQRQHAITFIYDYVILLCTQFHFILAKNATVLSAIRRLFPAANSHLTEFACSDFEQNRTNNE
ncbi:unnamed protein product [Clavelina lepadiformis]|uniref:Uncharacterized protein n=1 Tax=Clavelina lepadiformis TaxID=159417 RepID=A0ABP0G116_CLALP